MKFSFSRWSFLKSPGFTLVEVMVVIAIIGILAAIGMVSLGDSKDTAKNTKAQSDLQNIHAAMELLYSDTGMYPTGKNKYCPPSPTLAPGRTGVNEIPLNTALSGLVATDGSYLNWNGPYITNTIDPWGTPYYIDEDYQCFAGTIGCDGIADPGSDSAVIVSCGKNKKVGGSGCIYDDDNIVYVFCRL